MIPLDWDVQVASRHCLELLINQCDRMSDGSDLSPDEDIITEESLRKANQRAGRMPFNAQLIEEKAFTPILVEGNKKKKEHR